MLAKTFHFVIPKGNLRLSQDTPLKAPWQDRAGAHAKMWQEEWEARFCDELTPPREIQQLYQNVVAEFSRSFGELDLIPSQTLAPLPKEVQQMPELPQEP